jgi:hypothetical protein
MSSETKGSVSVSLLHTTVGPVTPSDFSDTTKEFGRTKDVERIFSVKRGTLYNAENLASRGASCSGCVGKKVE